MERVDEPSGVARIADEEVGRHPDAHELDAVRRATSMSTTDSVIGMPRPVSRTWSRHELRQSEYVDAIAGETLPTEQRGDHAVAVTGRARGGEHVEIIEPPFDVETGPQDS